MKAYSPFISSRSHRNTKMNLRNRLWYEQNGSCALCSNWVVRSAATFEHIIPRAKGGGMTYGNGLMTCTSCNSAKGDSMSMAYETYPHLQNEMI